MTETEKKWCYSILGNKNGDRFFKDFANELLRKEHLSQKEIHKEACEDYWHHVKSIAGILGCSVTTAREKLAWDKTIELQKKLRRTVNERKRIEKGNGRSDQEGK